MPLSDDDVREILRLIDESDLTELTVETEGFSLHVRKGAAREDVPSSANTPRSASQGTSSRSAQPHAAAREQPSQRAAANPGDGLLTVESPMLGTFYRAESPGAAPFTETGAEVTPDSTIGIIEVMKMMNSIPAGVSGTVAEVCAENGEVVEQGAPLIRVRAR